MNPSEFNPEKGSESLSPIWELGSLELPGLYPRFIQAGIAQGPSKLTTTRPSPPFLGPAAPQVAFWGAVGEFKARSEAAFVVGDEPAWQAFRVMSGAGTAKNDSVDKKIN